MISSFSSTVPVGAISANISRSMVHSIFLSESHGEAHSDLPKDWAMTIRSSVTSRCMVILVWPRLSAAAGIPHHASRANGFRRNHRKPVGEQHLFILQCWRLFFLPRGMQSQIHPGLVFANEVLLPARAQRSPAWDFSSPSRYSIRGDESFTRCPSRLRPNVRRLHTGRG